MATVDEVFNYVMYNPENTNPAILRGMLESMNNNSNSGIMTLHIIEAPGAGGTRNTTSYVLDKTSDEIYTFARPGGYVHIVAESLDGTAFFPLIICESKNGLYLFVFEDVTSGTPSLFSFIGEADKYPVR